MLLHLLTLVAALGLIAIAVLFVTLIVILGMSAWLTLRNLH